MTHNVDRAFIRRAVELSDLAALRAALYQASGDAELAALGPVVSLSPEDRLRLVERAAYLLETELPNYRERVPDDKELNHIMDLVLGAPTREEHFEVRAKMLAFESFPFLHQRSNGSLAIPDGFEVAIIGAGLSGVAMGVQLGLLGIPYVIYERRSEIGGTWSRHRYPDIRVDTLSITYEFSFDEQYPWREYFARGEDVREYIEIMAKKYGVYDHIQFDCELESARYDAANTCWQLAIRRAGGEPEVHEFTAVVTAAGLFSTPRVPDIPGTERFSGVSVHPTEWPADLDLSGKRVAIIGNGSTGVQMLATIAEDAAAVKVFQRTPQWISPREHYGEAIEPEVRWLFDNVPAYWNWCRYTSMINLFDWHQDYLTPDPEWEKQGGHITQKSEALRDILIGYIKSQIGDRPDLFEKLLPDHAPMLRRPVVDNGWYKALTRDNVELVTEGIAAVNADGIETVGGQQYDLDVIVYATGFDIIKYLWPAEFIGEDGSSLQQRWAEDSPRAYGGIMVPGFPNFFMLYGPNSQPASGGVSLISWFQIWAAYIGQCLEAIIEQQKSCIAVKQSAFNEHNAWLDEEASKLALVTEQSASKNYYVNEQGRLQVNSPFETADLWKLLKSPRLDDMELG